MSEFVKLPGARELQKVLGKVLVGTDAKIVSMRLEKRPTAPIYKLEVLVDAVDGYGFKFNHGMPDLRLLSVDVKALGKVIRQHLEARNGRNGAATAGVH